MPNYLNSAFDLRALLTDTLPYEVPVIFSNDRLYATIGTTPANQDLGSALEKIFKKPKGYTIPYSYNIRKNRNNFTTLGIIHPLLQIQIARFYTIHSHALISSCSRSDFSLRKPFAVAQRFTDLKIADNAAASKSGTVHEHPGQLDHDISHIISFFVYERYNLLGRFIDSPEFVELEKRFARLRVLDISKCFFNIYTHSVTWAVKDKAFAKEQARKTYSFEGELDSLMQKSNYNETNGIVIGPEWSRIFAEIILQDVDFRLREALSLISLRNETEYTLRRYVDDYYIFSNSDDILDRITNELRTQLENYKLFLNESKSITYSRPFVSNLTLAREELASLISTFSSALDYDESDTIAKQVRKRQKVLLRSIKQIRLVVSKFGVEFGNISGWLLTSIRNLLRRISAGMPSLTENDETEDVDAVIGLIGSLLEIGFYICAVDLRVRSTYSICQIAMLVQDLKGKVGNSHEQLEHILIRELSGLVEAITSRAAAGHFAKTDSVELCNILICGAHFIGADFVRIPAVVEAISMIVDSPPTYFGYVAAKFCLLKEVSMNFMLGKLNDAVDAKILNKPKAHEIDAETYLLICDHLAAPDLSDGNKRKLFTECFGGEISNNTLADLPKYVGFVDWTGMHVSHILSRKELRPVYSWS
jgi:hypothetical protein